MDGYHSGLRKLQGLAVEGLFPDLGFKDSVSVHQAGAEHAPVLIGANELKDSFLEIASLCE